MGPKFIWRGSVGLDQACKLQGKETGRKEGWTGGWKGEREKEGEQMSFPRGCRVGSNPTIPPLPRKGCELCHPRIITLAVMAHRQNDHKNYIK